MAYYNIDSGDGNELAAGLSEQDVERVAKRIANERGESVWYYQGGTAGEDEVESTEVTPDLPEDAVVVETMPECHRASHRAAGNWGVYPANGSERRIMTREDAEELVAEDEYDHIVRDAKQSDIAKYGFAR